VKRRLILVKHSLPEVEPEVPWLKRMDGIYAAFARLKSGSEDVEQLLAALAELGG